MHRDIKPGNILFNPEKKKIAIADWGLAEYYIPHTSYQARVASRFYKAPELLLEHQYYDY